MGDVMADVSLAFRDIAEERSTHPGRPRRRAGRLPRGDRPPGRQRGPARAAGAARRAARGACRSRSSSRCIRAPALRLEDGRAAWSGLGTCGVVRAARLPRLPEARPPRARGAHRLRRRAEGGVSARRPVHHAARHDRVGRDRRERLERARGPRSRRRAGRAGAAIRPPSGPSCTAAATPPNAFARCSGPTLSAYEDRSRRARIRRPAAGGRVLRGGARGGGRGHGRARGRGARRAGRSHVEDVPDESLQAIGSSLRVTTPRTPTSRKVGRDHRRGAHAAHAQPRAGPAAADRRRHGARGRAPAGPAGGARVDHLPGHHARAVRAAARGVGARRGARLPRRLLAGADRPGPHRLHAAQHAEGRGRPDRRVPAAAPSRSTARSATRSSRSRRPRRPS